MILAVSSQGMAIAADPVEDLRQTLRQILEQSFEPGNAEQAEQYKKLGELLKNKADQIVRPGDLRQALLSRELQVVSQQEPGAPQEEQHPFGKTGQEIRTRLAKRLEDALRSALKAPDPVRRLAAVTFLREMAREEQKQRTPVGPALPPPDRGRGLPGMPPGASDRFTPRLVPALDALARAKNEAPDVRAAAVRALARIAPGADKTLDALKPLLGAERTDVERRVAAESLGQMVRLLAEQERFAQVPGARLPSIPSALQAGPRLVAAAGLGLEDKDLAIRRLCLEAIRESAKNLMAFPKVMRPPVEAPPAAPGDGDGPAPKVGGLEKESVRLLARAVHEQMPAVRRNLGHSDAELRLAAHQVLETFASVRLHFAGKYLRKEEREWFGGLLDAVPELAKKSLSNEDVRTRLAALYVLETLGEAADSAVQELAKALKDDKNGFVRWGAARALSNMAPAKADDAVPALAGALKDDNPTVRLTALTALERYGPKAARAVNPLADLTIDPKQDAKMRLGALRTLMAIGKEARPATAAVVQALADPDSAVRAAAAAALGQFGDLNEDARKALAKALDDTDPAVRQAVSDTLLGGKPESPK
jgi:HEAT repeat protein